MPAGRTTPAYVAAPKEEAYQQPDGTWVTGVPPAAPPTPAPEVNLALDEGAPYVPPAPVQQPAEYAPPPMTDASSSNGGTYTPPGAAEAPGAYNQSSATPATSQYGEQPPSVVNGVGGQGWGTPPSLSPSAPPPPGSSTPQAGSPPIPGGSSMTPSPVAPSFAQTRTPVGGSAFGVPGGMPYVPSQSLPSGATPPQGGNDQITGYNSGYGTPTAGPYGVSDPSRGNASPWAPPPTPTWDQMMQPSQSQGAQGTLRIPIAGKDVPQSLINTDVAANRRAVYEGLARVAGFNPNDPNVDVHNQIAQSLWDAAGDTAGDFVKRAATDANTQLTGAANLVGYPLLHTGVGTGLENSWSEVEDVLGPQGMGVRQIQSTFDPVAPLLAGSDPVQWWQNNGPGPMFDESYKRDRERIEAERENTTPTSSLAAGAQTIRDAEGAAPGFRDTIARQAAKWGASVPAEYIPPAIQGERNRLVGQQMAQRAGELPPPSLPSIPGVGNPLDALRDASPVMQGGRPAVRGGEPFLPTVQGGQPFLPTVGGGQQFSSNPTEQSRMDQIVGAVQQTADKIPPLPQITMPTLPTLPTGGDIMQGGRQIAQGGKQFINTPPSLPGRDDVVQGGQRLIQGGQQIAQGGQRFADAPPSLDEVVQGGKQFVSGGKPQPTDIGPLHKPVFELGEPKSPPSVPGLNNQAIDADAGGWNQAYERLGGLQRAGATTDTGEFQGTALAGMKADGLVDENGRWTPEAVAKGAAREGAAGLPASVREANFDYEPAPDNATKQEVSNTPIPSTPATGTTEVTSNDTSNSGTNYSPRSTGRSGYSGGGRSSGSRSAGYGSSHDSGASRGYGSKSSAHADGFEPEDMESYLDAAGGDPKKAAKLAKAAKLRNRGKRLSGKKGRTSTVPTRPDSPIRTKTLGNLGAAFDAAFGGR